MIPGQRFLEWLQFVDSTNADLTLDEVQHDPSVYLLPSFESDEERDEALGAVCNEIFEDQLEAWYTNRAEWPADRSLEVFSRWFEVRFHSMVSDLLSQDVLPG